jgi:uncharacterized cupredoxin-like copper-binding protein
MLALAVTAPVAITLPGAGLHLSLTQDTAQSAMTVQVGEHDLFFNPNSITIPANTPIAFKITNEGAIRHNFSVTDHDNAGRTNLNVSFDTDPGQSGSATLNAPAGVYYFFCNEPGHEQAGMFGYLTVSDDASITTAEATVTPRAG